MTLSSPLAAPLLDHRGLDLDAAGRITYILEQSFRYDYDAPVESLRQRLVVVPPARHGGQHRRAHRLEVAGARARHRLRLDVRGNVVAWLRAERVIQAVEFRVAAVVEWVRADGPAVLPAAALRSPGLLRPTRLTAADDRLRDLASVLAGSRDSRSGLPSGSVTSSTPRSVTSTASRRCGPRPPRPWPAGAASARTTRT